MGYKKIKDLLPLGVGVISEITRVSTAKLPWNNSEFEPLFGGLTEEEMDLLYSIRSGDKVVPEVIQSEEMFNLFLRAVSHKHLYGWNEYCKYLLLEYNPIENYRMEETQSTTGNNSGSSTQTTNMTSNLSRSDTTTHDMTVDETSNIKNSNEETASGTNSNSTTTDMTVAGTTGNTRTDALKTTISDNTNTVTSESTSGSYKDSTAHSSSVSESGNTTTRHDDMLAFTDETKHVADSYLKTTEQLIAGFDSNTAQSSTEGKTTLKDTNTTNQSSIGVADTSGYDRQSKTIEGEAGGYSDIVTHTPNGTSYTEDTVTHGKTTTDSGTATDNYTERTYNNFSQNGTVSVEKNMEQNNTGTVTDSGSDSHTTEGTVTVTGSDSRTVNNSGSETGTRQDKTTGTVSDVGTSENATTGTVGVESNGTHSETMTHTRSGNIGVTTSQQMLLSELDIVNIREKIVEKIFSDLDKELTIPIWV